MNVASILKEKGHEVSTVGPDKPVVDVARELTECRIGAVLVTEGERVLGILSERDIVKAVAREGKEALERPARDVMTSRVITCSLSDTAEQLMDAMTQGRFRHLPVIEGERLIGIISIGDVVKHRIAETVMEKEALQLYIANG